MFRQCNINAKVYLVVCFVAHSVPPSNDQRPNKNTLATFFLIHLIVIIIKYFVFSTLCNGSHASIQMNTTDLHGSCARIFSPFAILTQLTLRLVPISPYIIQPHPKCCLRRYVHSLCIQSNKFEIRRYRNARICHESKLGIIKKHKKTLLTCKVLSPPPPMM